MKKRMVESLIGGAILGVFCVIGAYVRSDFTASKEFVFSLWYNRIIIGLVVGAPWARTTKIKTLIRGAILGLLVSFAFFATTAFKDPISFIAGIVYGIILETWLSRSKR